MASGSGIAGDDGPDALDGNGGRGLAPLVELVEGPKLSTARARFDTKGHFVPALLVLPSGLPRLPVVIFDASNVCLSCQTHSVAAGKHEVSMGAMVARASPWTSTVLPWSTMGLEVLRAETNGDHRETRGKTVSRGMQAQGRRLSRVADLAAKRAVTRT
jgi:hypothetical protein